MLLSTAYLPSIQYISLCTKNHEVYIESYEHFIKQSYRNRTQIASANGVLDLIIPVIKPQGSKTLITDVRIAYDDTWNKQHWHAIVSAYNSSPFFEFYADEFAPFYQKKFNFLLDFNEEICSTIFKILGLKTELQHTTEFLKPDSLPTDYRYALSPKNAENQFDCKPYIQVFDEKFGFLPNLSILDLLCNIGPESRMYLQQ